MKQHYLIFYIKNNGEMTRKRVYSTIKDVLIKYNREPYKLHKVKQLSHYCTFEDIDNV